jgi:hypothetical protein
MASVDVLPVNLFKGRRFIRDFTAVELALLRHLLQWVSPRKPTFAEIFSHRKGGPEPALEDVWLGLPDFFAFSLALKHQCRGQEFFPFLKTFAGNTYHDYFYASQSRMLDVENAIICAFSSGYRLLGFKFYNFLNLELRLGAVLGQSFVEGAGLTTGLEMEKFRLLQLNGIAPKTNSIYSRLSLEQLALLNTLLKNSGHFDNGAILTRVFFLIF